MEIYDKLIEFTLSDDFTVDKLRKLKIKLCKEYKVTKIPTNFDLLLYAKDNIPLLRQRLQTKPTRSISGVSPVAIMTSPTYCPHGKCTFCPGGPGSPFGDVPQSYTGQEPASMRGMRNFWDAYLQVFNRLEQFIVTCHPIDKIELIIMGGTFPAMPLDYQHDFIRDAFQAMNDFSELFFIDGELQFEKFKEFFLLPGEVGSKERTEKIHAKLRAMKKDTSLEEEQVKNETTKARCVALCIETKPDWGMLPHGNRMLTQGCTRIELGIQTLYDEALHITHRGHTLQESVDSIRILRDLGFKINFHVMLGMPGVTKEMDIKALHQLHDDPDYRPDMIKLYPTMVSKGTPLYNDYKAGKYTPPNADEAAELIAIYQGIVPEYCRIQRVLRDVPTKQWEAGVEFTNLRQYVDQKHQVKSRDIRAREPKNLKIDVTEAELKVLEYEASRGTEFFISFEHPPTDKLLGFLRLRFPSESLRPEITTTSALVREIHVYGVQAKVGAEGTIQHRGFGKKLLAEAERIAKERGYDKLVVISGVGAREYYRKLGYEREGPYMVKML